MFDSISQNLVFGTPVSLSRWLRWIEYAVNVVLDTSITWPFAVTFDFPISATNAGIGRSARDIRGGENGGGHDIYI